MKSLSQFVKSIRLVLDPPQPEVKTGHEVSHFPSQMLQDLANKSPFQQHPVLFAQ